jgi:hypothetical protein
LVGYLPLLDEYNKGHHHVEIVDVMLPEMNGLEVLKHFGREDLGEYHAGRRCLGPALGGHFLAVSIARPITRPLVRMMLATEEIANGGAAPYRATASIIGKDIVRKGNKVGPECGIRQSLADSQNRHHRTGHFKMAFYR